MEFLTTSEAADYLRLGERKLYELVTTGAIPCTKVTGKWLFPRHELDLWVLSGTGASGRHADRRAAAGRRRQPGRASGLEPARIRLGPGIDERGQRARARALAARRGDGRGGALPRLEADGNLASDANADGPCVTLRTCMMHCWSPFVRREQGLAAAAGQSRSGLRGLLRRARARGPGWRCRQQGTGAQIAARCAAHSAPAPRRGDLRRIETPGPDRAGSRRDRSARDKPIAELLTRAVRALGRASISCRWSGRISTSQMRQRSYFRPADAGA